MELVRKGELFGGGGVGVQKKGKQKKKEKREKEMSWGGRQRTLEVRDILPTQNG